jgi:hypothetical protein
VERAVELLVVRPDAEIRVLSDHDLGVDEDARRPALGARDGRRPAPVAERKAKRDRAARPMLPMPIETLTPTNTS